MTIRTLGSNANNSLSAIQVGINDVIPADLATMLNQLRGDPPGYLAPGGGAVAPTSTVRPRLAQAYVKNGVLYVPNRGVLQLRNGDWVAWDTTTGWPIVLSNDAATNGPYTHS